MGKPKKVEEDHRQPELFLNKDYGFSTDERCVTLLKRETVQKEDSINFGKNYWTVLGYYNNFQEAMKAMLDKDIQTENKSFDFMLDRLTKLKSDIETFFKNENLQIQDRD